ncbi:MAG: NosD domain-containing protein [Thermofilum sp.]
MLERRFSSVLLTVVLVLSVFSVKPAGAVWTGGKIYIRADGRVEPADAPITTKDGVTYTLTDDIQTEEIIVERDNIILDGNGHTVTGQGKGFGIRLENRRNVTVRNLKIEKFDTGIYVKESSYITIAGNTLTNNGIGIRLDVSGGNMIVGNTIANNRHGGIHTWLSSSSTISKNTITNNSYYGIHLWVSNGNRITGNTIANSSYGIRIMYSIDNRIAENVFWRCGLSVLDSYFNVVEGNTVNGKPLVYLENARDVVVRDAGQVILVRSVRVRVENLNLSNTTVGVQLWNSSECTIVNNTITNNKESGIYLWGSSGNTITGNRIAYNDWYGIYLQHSSGNTIAGNTIADGSWYGIHLSASSGNRITGNVFRECGLFVYDSYSNVVEGNTVNGKPLVYLENARDVVVRDAGQVILVRSVRVRVENSNLSNATVGVELWESSECTIANNIISNNKRGGIYLWGSSGNTITGNRIAYNDWYGISLERSSGNTIAGNKISNNYGGIGLWFSSGNTIAGSTIADNGEGIGIYYSNGNTITGNKIANNKRDGIILLSSNNNRISLNNFIDNGRQVDSEDSVNVWDDGSRGNFWSDYKGSDANNDGVGDTPYTIDEKNVDRYPLIYPYGFFPIKVTSPYGTASGEGLYEKGSKVTISLSPVLLDHGNGTRRVFSGWYDEKGVLLSMDPAFSLIVDKPLTVTAKWGTEYRVEVHSPYGSVRGSGWYERGSTATISVSPAVVDAGFFTEYVFEGWVVEGELVSASPEHSFTVDKPVTLTARWGSRVKLANVLAVVVLAALTAALLAWRSRASTRAKKE